MLGVALLLVLVGALAMSPSMLLAPATLTVEATGPQPVPAVCRPVVKATERWNVDTSSVASARTLLMGGQSVRLRGMGWAASDPLDPSWTVWYHSLAWLVPIALSDKALAIDLFEERDKVLPDPPQEVPRGSLRKVGWTEGQVRVRLRTAVCLWELTGNPRLIPIVERLVDASFDPMRYRGLPLKAVHNHGAMSNLAVISAGVALQRVDWVRRASVRLGRDAAAVFGDCGMAFEQSSTYQKLNVRLYGQREETGLRSASMGRQALGALVRPDGVLEAIGDGQPASGLAPTRSSLWCPEAGWAANTRLGSHYTLRFGPAVDFHGHQDHTSVTWFARGVAILSDRGLADKGRGFVYSFYRSMAAHSVLEPVGMPEYDPVTRGERLRPDEYVLASTDAGVLRRRYVRVTPTELIVRDMGGGAVHWVQHWQLAPGWEPTEYGAIHRTGLKLTVTCPSRSAVKVQHAVARGASVDAWDLQCAVSSPSGAVDLTTTLRVH